MRLSRDSDRRARRRARLSAVSMTVMGVTVLVLPLSASGASAAPLLADAACGAYATSHDASVLPARFSDAGCNWVGREIRNGLVGVEVPQRGETVAVDALTVSGSVDLVVTHSAQGTIALQRFDNTGPAAHSSAQVTPYTTPLPACSDSAGTDYGYKVEGSYDYYYNSYAQPAADPGTAAALSAAHTNLQTSYTDCSGLTRPQAPPVHYDGLITGRYANITTSYTCASSDGFSVISWLSKPGGALALTCTWAPGGVVQESDAVMNTAYSFFTGSTPAGCSGSYDLQGVMTHEAGHTYGLNHADTGGTDHTVHANLTMNSQLDSCTTKYRTLGAGDLNAMLGHY